MNENNVGHDVSTSLSFSEKASYCSILPPPPIEVQRFQLRERSASGCDRSCPNVHYKNSNDGNNLQNWQRRSSQGNNNELDPNDHVVGSREMNGSSNEDRSMALQHKKKVLTGRYAHRTPMEGLPICPGSNMDNMRYVKESLDICRNCIDVVSQRMIDPRNDDYNTAQTSSRPPPKITSQQGQICNNPNCTKCKRRKPPNDQDEFRSLEPSSEDNRAAPIHRDNEFSNRDQAIPKQRRISSNTGNEKQPQYDDLRPESDHETEYNDGTTETDYNQKQTNCRSIEGCAMNCPARQWQKAKDFQIFIRPKRTAKVQREMRKQTKMQKEQEENAIREAPNAAGRRKDGSQSDLEYDNEAERSSPRKKVYCSNRAIPSNTKEPQRRELRRRDIDNEHDEDNPKQEMEILYCSQKGNHNSDNPDNYVECPNMGRENNRNYKDYDDVPNNSLKAHRSNRNNSVEYIECSASRQRNPQRKDDAFYEEEDGFSRDSKKFYSSSKSKKDSSKSEEYIKSSGSKRMERVLEPCCSNTDCPLNQKEKSQIMNSSGSKRMEMVRGSKDFENELEIYCSDADCPKKPKEKSQNINSSGSKRFETYCSDADCLRKPNKNQRSKKDITVKQDDSAEMLDSYGKKDESGKTGGSNNQKAKVTPQFTEASVETDIDMTLSCRNRELCRKKSCKSEKSQSNNPGMVPQFSNAWAETDLDMTLSSRNRESCRCKSKQAQNQENSSKNSEGSEPKIKDGNICETIVRSVSAAKSKVKSPQKKMKPLCRCTQPVFNKNKNRSTSQAPRAENLKQRSATSGQVKHRGNGQKRYTKMEEDASGKQLTVFTLAI